MHRLVYLQMRLWSTVPSLPPFRIRWRATFRSTLTRNTAPPGWLSIFQDVMSIAGPIVGGVANASGGPPSGIVASSGIAMLDFIVNQSAVPTDNTSGAPLQATEQVEQAASMLASAAVNNYLQYLAGLGKMVNRIAGDPNRLNHFFAAQQLLAAATLTQPPQMSLARRSTKSLSLTSARSILS